jgi:ferredoxin
MKANYGYEDGSGGFFITIDTDACNGCGDCVEACPAGLLEVGEDENDPLNDDQVATVVAAGRRKLESECSPCKPASGRPELPCVEACMPAAITHSW